MVLDISGINFFMPVFSFLFVSLVVYAILLKTELLGKNKFFLVFLSFILGVIFMSFASMETYVRTILPWFVVLLVIVFLVLVVAGFSTKSMDKIMTPTFAWVAVGVLIIIFLIAAIKVFNPIFHQDLLITSGDSSTTVFSQILYFLVYSKWAGSIFLVIIAGIVAWVIGRGGK